MKNEHEPQHCVIPLRGRCDKCGEERLALLSTFVYTDDNDVLHRSGTTVFLSPDKMITTDYFKRPDGQEVEVAVHWEGYTGEEKEKRWLKVLARVRELQDMGVYDDEDALGVMQRYTRDPNRDDRKQRCGTFDFEDYQTGCPVVMNHIIDFSEQVGQWSLAKK